MKTIWKIISGISTVLGIVGYFKQYPINQNETTMNWNSLLIFIGIIGAFSYMYMIFREKISALKKYRDAEAIFLTNRFNEAISSITKSNGMTNNYDNKNDEIYQLYSKAINEYNDAFKSWGMGDYGTSDNTTAKKRTLK